MVHISRWKEENEKRTSTTKKDEYKKCSSKVFAAILVNLLLIEWSLVHKCKM